MAFRDTSSFGKRMEFEIISKMLSNGYDVYLPLVDDHGVDCVVKKADGTFVEIQIKARSESAKHPGWFVVDEHEVAIDNFYFVFYSEKVDKTWVFSSKDFVDNSYINKSGKNAGKRKIVLLNSSGNISPKYEKYIIKNFDFLK